MSGIPAVRTVTPGGRQPGDLDRWRERVRELIRDWRDAGRLQPRADCWLRAFDLDFSREMARRGLLGISWPQRFGGGGAGAVARLAVTEELLRAGAPVAAHWIGDRQIGPAILRHGNRRLQEEILPGITSGRMVFCLGMSEPGAGSDLAAVTTRASKVPGGWRISGRKTWTSNAHLATHAYVLARTDASGRKHEGLTEFVVDMAAAGVEVAPIRDMSGEHHFNEVTFDGVEVPEHCVIGEVGRGWRQVVEQLSFERGGPERVLTTYPLLAAAVAGIDHDRLDAELGMLVARLTGLRRLCYAIATRIDAGQSPVVEAAALKVLGTTFEVDVIEFARRAGVRDGGGSQLHRESLLTSPGFSIRGGSSDVLLTIVSKAAMDRV